MTLNGLHAMKRLQAGWGFGDTALCVFFFFCCRCFFVVYRFPSLKNKITDCKLNVAVQ